MGFNPDPMKDAQEVTFSRKINKAYHPDFIFNANSVKKSSYQKNLEIFLDSKLDFDEHIEEVFDQKKETDKGNGIVILDRKSTITLMKKLFQAFLNSKSSVKTQP